MKKMVKPKTMKAVGFFSPLPVSESEYLVDLRIDIPKPEGRDLLVQVKAVSINPADVKSRSGKKAASSEPIILGWDAAGIVVETGPDCSLFKPGDEVYYAGSIDRPGCNSEFHLVDERITGRKPKTLSFAEAAAMPLTSLTAWEGLFDRLGISRNASDNRHKSILMIGAAGGVGSVAAQLAKYAGLTVIGTASRAESIRWAKEYGADIVINHNEALQPQLSALGLAHVDYIFCLNDTEAHWNSMAEAIRPQGAICSIVPVQQPVNLGLLFAKSVSFHWELMFTRAKYQTDDMIEQHNLLSAVAELIDCGKLKTTMAQLLKPINASNLRFAHEKVRAGNMVGKLVLEQF